jgi:hypothetical protein
MQLTGDKFDSVLTTVFSAMIRSLFQRILTMTSSGVWSQARIRDLPGIDHLQPRQHTGIGIMAYHLPEWRLSFRKKKSTTCLLDDFGNSVPHFPSLQYSDLVTRQEDLMA